ncbi:MAG TPA: radical SAM protein [Nitrospirae bacterium]|nr:radical SAM protein [Nitrospirota bacterium]HDZ87906.1 radical SAM protein [Nitrospirota bacterium]
MRILLCYPFRDDTYRKVGFILPPMGLGYIAAVLRAHGHRAEIVDFNIAKETPDYSLYDIVGISCDTSRYNAGVRIAEAVRAAGKTVVMGGPHVTFNDGEALETGLCDYVVRGEGEYTFLALVNALQSKGHISDVKGLSFPDGESVIRTPDAEPPDIRMLPLPARDLMDIGAYSRLEMGGRKMTSIVTSRGCPYNCSFCSSSEFSGLKWRFLEPAVIVDEVEDIVDHYGFDGIAFLDDNFTLKPERVMEICDRITDRKIDIYWWCFSRADTILKNEDMVRSMARAGAKYIFMGFESRSAAILDHYKKRITPDMAKEAVGLLKAYGISTHASFIIGDIHETEDMVMDTIKYAKEIEPEAVQFSILTPYPGTRLFDEVRDRIFTHDWDLYDCLHPVIRLDYMNNEKVKKLLQKAYLSFYLSPRRIYNGIFSTFRGKGIRLGSIIRIFRGLN